ncbi:MAG: hypothetical protein LAT66_08750 [Alkalimonas sp.]|nr:hypothetical protein [Alkalimonas sp.]
MDPKPTPPKAGKKRKRLQASRPDPRVTARIRSWLYRLLVLGIILLAVVFFAEALVGIWRESF